jgi:hypothetical protein
MNNDQRIREEVEKTMESLDGLQKLQPNPFLASRIQVRLAAEISEADHAALGVLRLKPVALAVVVVLNIVTVVYALTSKSEISTREQLVTSLSQEYGSGSNDF